MEKFEKQVEASEYALNSSYYLYNISKILSKDDFKIIYSSISAMLSLFASGVKKTDASFTSYKKTVETIIRDKLNISLTEVSLMLSEITGNYESYLKRSKLANARYSIKNNDDSAKKRKITPSVAKILDGS